MRSRPCTFISSVSIIGISAITTGKSEICPQRLIGDFVVEDYLATLDALTSILIDIEKPKNICKEKINMNTQKNYYAQKCERILAYFDHVPWCGVQDVRQTIKDWMAETRAAHTTWYHRTASLIALHKWAHGKDLSKTLMLQYYEDLRLRKVRDSSIKAEHVRIKSFCAYLYKKDLYDDIMKDIEPPTGEYREKQCLTAAELNTLLKRITDIRDKTIVSLMSICGLRCIEISEMQWGDIQADRMIVRGKGRAEKNTAIVLPISIQRLLLDLKRTTNGKTDPEDYVFISETRRSHAPISATNISKIVRAILRDKLPEKKAITPHGLRHTAITLAIEAGMDIHRVSKFARHKSIATTSVYIHDNEKFSNPVEAHIEALVDSQDTQPNDDLSLLKHLLSKLIKS